ncbi:Hypothetical predicted protein [Cloeon dipterum]|uniref:BTB domain-containing protein n=1 Tax=Cloeon dipterum TaxID=197152 RepID=A0A8S1DW12_9INSE|nr:Hypothetical predicted protein [Cloeon dipterum]
MRTRNSTKSASIPAKSGHPVPVSEKGKRGSDLSTMKTVAAMKLKALADGHLTDCVFLVGRNERLAKEIRAFRLELIVSSEYFSGLLNSPLTLANPGPIRVKTIEPDVFKLVIEFIHLSGHLKSKVGSLEVCLQLARAADEYLLDDLSHLCLEQLRNKFLLVDNVWNVLTEHRLIRGIAKACLELLEVHASECLREVSFFEASEEAVKLFLSLDKMEIESEMELVDACIEYAEKKKEKKDVFRRAFLPNLRLLNLSTKNLMKVLPFLTVEEKTYLAAHGSPLKVGWTPKTLPSLCDNGSSREKRLSEEPFQPGWSAKRRRAVRTLFVSYPSRD